MESKSFCIFRSLVLVAPLLDSLVLAGANDEEDVQKTVGGFSQSWNHHDIQRSRSVCRAGGTYNSRRRYLTEVRVTGLGCFPR